MGNISLKLLCGGGVRSILFPLVARCLDNRCVYISVYVCCSDCMGVCRNGCCVAGVVEDGVLALDLKYVCVGDVMDVVFSG